MTTRYLFEHLEIDAMAKGAENSPNGCRKIDFSAQSFSRLLRV